MKKINHILLGFLICFSFNGCVQNEVEFTGMYNEKANEIILQTIKENNCNCLLEIPKESMIETNTAENPVYDIRSFLIKELNTKNNAGLDSLVGVSKNFSLDTETLKKFNIKTVSLENLNAIKNDNFNGFLKICPNGLMYIQKPIFNKQYQKAVLDFGRIFTCGKTLPLPVYEFKNGKWNLIEKRRVQ